ncbi:mitochondrial folate transporter/carrier-like [Trichogramma pretiosum]|uniref:mitochondrial folate transporter/carrier-like n=1 Tax=Trichogramma pretiosum TaxID=7493 RepID=UPI0006C963E7|nr:mitochondrial folate transporter/carrier-like [Trichogramma pretiosum]
MSAAQSYSNSSNSKYLSVFKHVKFEHLVAGGAGGLISSVALHPFDLIKIRFAVNDGQSKIHRNYTGFVNAVQNIVRSESFAGLYSGAVPSIVGAAFSWGSYLLIYNFFKSYIQDGNDEKALNASMNTLCAANAGVITLLMSNPIFVIKTRLCLQYSKGANLPESKRYTGMIDAVHKISKNEGIRGLYKGLVPGLFGVSHGTLQFVVYEEMKNQYNIHLNHPVNRKLETKEYTTFAAFSKLFALAVTYPHQVLKTRLHDVNHNYTGTIDCIKRIWKHEGIHGYYKGLNVNLLKVPATVITLVVYENIKNHLLKSKSEEFQSVKTVNNLEIKKL